MKDKRNRHSDALVFMKLAAALIHCPYQEGHVTYDDCSLIEEKP